MSNAFGSFGFPQLRRAIVGAGIATELGTFIGPGARIAAYVRSGGPVSGGDAELYNKTVTTLNAGLSQCRSGMGDVVLVAHDHSESISTADQMTNLVAGTRILGLGYGALRPTFNWTAAASSSLFDVANVVLANCILDFCNTAATTVTAPITISAAGCGLIGCRVNVATGAAQLCTIGVTTTDAADDLMLAGCQFMGATAGEVTTMVDVLGCDRMRMHDCYFEGATSSTTVGVVRFNATAATFLQISESTFINRKAASVHAVTGVASTTGYVRDCDFGILDNATLAGWVTKGNSMFFRCQTVNLAGETGAATSTPST